MNYQYRSWLCSHTDQLTIPVNSPLSSILLVHSWLCWLSQKHQASSSKLRRYLLSLGLHRRTRQRRSEKWGNLVVSLCNQPGFKQTAWLIMVYDGCWWLLMIIDCYCWLTFSTKIMIIMVAFQPIELSSWHVQMLRGSLQPLEPSHGTPLTSSYSPSPSAVIPRFQQRQVPMPGVPENLHLKLSVPHFGDDLSKHHSGKYQVTQT